MHIKINIKLILLLFILYHLSNDFQANKYIIVGLIALFMYSETNTSNPTELSRTLSNPTEPFTSTPGVMKTGLMTTDKIVADSVDKSCDCEKAANGAIVRFLQNRRLIDKNGLLYYADSYFGDMGHSDIKLDSYIPLAASMGREPPKNERDNLTKAQNGIEPHEKNQQMSFLTKEYGNKLIKPPNTINIDYINDKLNN